MLKRTAVLLWAIIDDVLGLNERTLAIY